MTLTEGQIQRRKKYIGSSEAPVICGVHPFKSPTLRDIYDQKTMDLEPKKPTKAQAFGLILEPAMLNWFVSETGLKIRRNVFRANDVLGATLDADVVGQEEAVETKYRGDPEPWGDPRETNAVPEDVLVQTALQMYITGYRLIWVPVLLPVFGRPEPRLYRVVRNDELCEAVAAKCRAFWEQHVEPKVPPTDEPSSLQTLSRLVRPQGKRIELPKSCLPVIYAYQDVQEGRRATESHAKETKAQVIALLEDAEEAVCGSYVISYRQTERKGYTVEPTSYRTLRIKEGK